MSLTVNFEKQYVYDVYRDISQQFDKSRSNFNRWGSVVSFVNSIPSKSSILDIGCGNGRNLQIRDDLIGYGCDICPEMVNICVNKGLNVVESKCTDLPYLDNTFDAVMSVAVIHHLYNPSDRVKAIEEMCRVCKPSGFIYLQVWADSAATKATKFRHIGNNDYLVKWDNNKERYYHLFAKDEIDTLIKNNSTLDHNNWCCAWINIH